MSVYYYEPFYNFDRFFENLAGRPSSTDAQLPAAENTMPVVVRPKYVVLLVCFSCCGVLTGSM